MAAPEVGQAHRRSTRLQSNTLLVNADQRDGRQDTGRVVVADGLTHLKVFQQVLGSFTIMTTTARVGWLIVHIND